MGASDGGEEEGAEANAGSEAKAADTEAGKSTETQHNAEFDVDKIAADEDVVDKIPEVFLVIGTHPHVIEPVEIVSDENGNEMLIYYSLGNFVNWTSSSGDGIANRMVGGIAEVTIQMTEDGEAYIADYGVEPLVCHLTEGAGGVTMYLLSDYTEEMAAENAILAQDSNFSKEYCKTLCEEVWGTVKE